MNQRNRIFQAAITGIRTKPADFKLRPAGKIEYRSRTRDIKTIVIIQIPAGRFIRVCA